MQGFTYTQLSQALQDWAENTSDETGEFVDNIPRLVQLGEIKVVKELNLEIFDVIDSSTVVTAGSRTVTKPTDLIVARSLSLVTGGVTSPLYMRSYDFINNYAPDSTVLGTPKYYAEVSDTTWTIVPTPTLTATIRSRGVYRPASIVEDETTWLGDHCGELLFHAARLHAEDFLKADDRMDDVAKLYQEALAVSRAELRNLIRAGDYAPYRATSKKAG